MAREDHVLIKQTPTRGLAWVLYYGIVLLAAMLWRLIFFWSPRGAHNIPRQGAFLLVANHPSYIDPPTIVGSVIYLAGRDISIMAWDKLWNIPVVRQFCIGYKAFPVHRERPGASPFVTLVDILNNGGAAAIFPEGARSNQRLMGPWKPGALRAALQARATILPVSMASTGEMWPRVQRMPRIFYPLIQIFHEPIPFDTYMAWKPEGMSDREFEPVLAERIRAIINAPIQQRMALYDAHYTRLFNAKDPLREDDSAPELTRAERHARVAAMFKDA